MSDDHTMVQNARLGDAGAFSQLLKANDDKMRGVVWRLVPSVSEMDDILQDAYLKAWRNLDEFRGDAAFSSWLYRIVYTTALDHLKAQRRRRVVPLDEARGLSVDDATGVLVESDALRTALAELPEDQLAVVALVDGQGASYDDVAAMLGIQPGTVGSRLTRARATLRQKLATEGTRGRS